MTMTIETARLARDHCHARDSEIGQLEQRQNLDPNEFTRSVGFQAELYTAMAQQNVFLRIADLATKGDPRMENAGSKLKVPFLKTLGTAAETTEGTAIAESTPEFGSQTLTPAPIKGRHIASMEWEQDGGSEWLSTGLALGLGNAGLAKCTADFVSQVPASGLAGGLTAENLFKLRRTINPGYRTDVIVRNGRELWPRWMAHPSVAADMRAAMAGHPGGWESYDRTLGGDLCDGFPVAENDQMPTSGGKEIIFCAFGWVVVYFPEGVVINSGREALADTGQIQYVGVGRVACGLMIDGAATSLNL